MRLVPTAVPSLTARINYACAAKLVDSRPNRNKQADFSRASVVDPRGPGTSGLSTLCTGGDVTPHL